MTREPRGTAWSDSVSVAPGKCRRLEIKAMGAGRRKEGLRDDRMAPMVSTSARVRVSFPCLDHFSFRSAHGCDFTSFRTCLNVLSEEILPDHLAP